MRYEQMLLWAMVVALFAGVAAYNLTEQSNLYTTVGVCAGLLVGAGIGYIITKKV